MPNLGFDVRDRYTLARVGAPPVDDLYVLVPRRDATLPPLVETFDSSVRLRERRNFFETLRSASGLIVAPDVPAGTYSVRIEAPYYSPFTASVISPQSSPLSVLLYRDASYPFSAEDTIVRGLVVEASGSPHTGFDVNLLDAANATIDSVPLNADGEYVFYLPNLTSTAGVTVEAIYAAGSVQVPVAAVVLNRPNLVPLITVP
jgi:hypothetical protein